QVAGEASDDGADQGHQRDVVLVESDGVGQFFHRERAEGIDLPIAGLMRVPGRRDQVLGGGELGHDSVGGNALHSGFTSASGRSVRISKMEIMGRMRTKRNMAVRNMPMVPK